MGVLAVTDPRNVVSVSPTGHLCRREAGWENTYTNVVVPVPFHVIVPEPDLSSRAPGNEPDPPVAASWEQELIVTVPETLPLAVVQITATSCGRGLVLLPDPPLEVAPEPEDLPASAPLPDVPLPPAEAVAGDVDPLVLERLTPSRIPPTTTAATTTAAAILNLGFFAHSRNGGTTKEYRALMTQCQKKDGQFPGMP
jgi:hypothetical protein